MRNKTISYLWNANSIKITDEISTGITCSRVQFKFQCCKSVWASWCHSKERFIDRIIMLWLIYIKVTSSLLLPSHFFEELKFSVEVQLLVVLIQSFLLLSCEESSSVSPWSHYRFSCSSISGRWWWTIFSAIVSPHPFSHSHPGSLLLSLKGSLPADLCTLLQPPTEEIFTPLWRRDGSRTEILVWKVSLL